MKKTLVLILSSFLGLILNLNASSALGGGNSTTSTITYDLDACEAFVLAGTVGDYSEFVGSVQNDAECSQLQAISTIYRDNPTVYTHSCTPGVNGTNAMCVSSLADCNYDPGNAESIKFDVMVMPGSNGTGNISNLSFYELAPQNYFWVAGPSGLNDYPTKYGVRVLKNGTEIYRSAELETTQDWTLETFDFSNNSEFTVTEPSIFTFELLSYCLVGNNAGVSVWDIDNVVVTSTCEGDAIQGGTLTIDDGSTGISICANDGISDAFDVNLIGQTGSESAWLITDQNGNILDLPAGPPFDLEGAGTGVCLIWHLSYEGVLNGLASGVNVNTITGCYALSSPITVTRNMSMGSSIVTTTGAVDVTICAGDGIPDPIDVTVSGSSSAFNAWIITDTNGNILDLPAGPPFDLEGAGLGVCQIWYAGYDGALTGVEIGSNVSGIVGCFGLSNPIVVRRVTASAGTITSNGQTEFSICAGDGVADLIDVQLTGNVGAFQSWVITDANGNITDLPAGPPFNLDGAVNGQCLIWHLSYDGSIGGLAIGQNASNLTGCFGLSNAITVNKTRTSGGVLSYENRTFLQLCGGDPILNSLQPVLNGNSGSNLSWLLTDEMGNVLDFLSPPPFDISGLATGRYRIYGLSYDGTDAGITVGQNVEILTTECAGLSNPLILAIENAIGGTIGSATGDVVNLCIDGPSSMSTDFSLTGNVGTFSRWLVTDLNGNIVGLPSAPPFSLDFIGLPQCLLYHLSYEPSFTGLFLGNNISAFTGCYDLSNSITLNKQSAIGGVLSFDGVTTSLSLCGANANSSVNVVLNNAEGENSAWVLTDENLNIIDLPAGPPFDFLSYGEGNYRLWHLSYNGAIAGAEIGQNATNLSGDCFGLSNFISISVADVNGGTITTSSGSNLTICAGDGTPDIFDISLTDNVGPNSLWIITDTAGNITNIPGTPPFDLDNGTGNTCVIWHVSYSSLTGVQLGANVSGFQGCFDISNSITVNKTNVNAGTITSSLGNVITACVDGINDNIDASLTGATGSNNQWVITDTNGTVLGLPLSPPFDFDPAGVGTCLIWNLSFENINGLAVGNNVSGLTGCFGLSNSITVNREQKDAGDISLSDGGTEYTICAGDGSPDPIDVFVNGGDVTGNIGWVITDQSLNILGLPMAPPFDLEDAGAGTCLIWRISYSSDVTGIAVGANAGNLFGCFDLSNPITVTRIETSGASQSTSFVNFNLDACYSDSQDGSNNDYSEFTGDVNNDAECTTYEVVGTLNRTNPSVNAHSCTPGVNGSTAMCVSSYPFCDFTDDNERAIRFSVNVSPAANGQGALSSLSFYEKAPITYEWINGASGLNNHPTKYGVRILKNGVEIYKQEDINTSSDWTLETFDFSTNPDFTIDAVTRFDFELLGYCRIENGATVSAWDIDEVIIGSSCTSGLSAGVLTTTDGLTELETCAGDGVSDAFNTMVVGAAGDNAAWVITDENLNILDLPAGPPFDFEGAGAGVCLVWYITFSNGLIGAEVGLNAANLQGCYALSNPITVTRLSGTDCNSPNNVDPTGEEEIEVLTPELVQSFDVLPNPAVEKMTIKTDNMPMVGTQMFVYDRMGKIIERVNLEEQSTDILLDGYPAGIYYVKVISGRHQSSQSFIKL